VIKKLFDCTTCGQLCERKTSIVYCSLLCRFKNNITKISNDCWHWTGRFDEDGYGKINYAKKTKRTHRLSYELHVGPIPEKLLVLHKCHDRKCVNPDHLKIGTNDENMSDMVEAGRSVRGSATHSAKLNQLDVLEIRNLRKQNFTQQSIADKYNVSQFAIAQIVNNKTWKHI